jgi:hypothetical protein
MIKKTTLFQIFQPPLRDDWGPDMTEAMEVFVAKARINIRKCDLLVVPIDHEGHRGFMVDSFADEPRIKAVSYEECLRDLAAAHRKRGDEDKARTVDAVNELINVRWQSLDTPQYNHGREILLHACIICCALKREGELLACGNMSILLNERLTVGRYDIGVIACSPTGPAVRTGVRGSSAIAARRAAKFTRCASFGAIDCSLICIDTTQQRYYESFVEKAAKIFQENHGGRLCTNIDRLQDIYSEDLYERVIGKKPGENYKMNYFFSVDSLEEGIFPSEMMIRSCKMAAADKLDKYRQEIISWQRSYISHPQIVDLENYVKEARYGKAFLDIMYNNSQVSGVLCNDCRFSNQCTKWIINKILAAPSIKDMVTNKHPTLDPCRAHTPEEKAILALIDCCQSAIKRENDECEAERRGVRRAPKEEEAYPYVVKRKNNAYDNESDDETMSLILPPPSKLYDAYYKDGTPVQCTEDNADYEPNGGWQMSF